jgi:ribonuclease HII
VIIGGDGLSAAVAAASIVAKVTRDRLMCALHDLYPQWGFPEHVGYGTAGHHEAIACHGICALHRRSFQSFDYRQLDLGLLTESAEPQGRPAP